eukprot:RCo023781
MEGHLYSWNRILVEAIMSSSLIPYTVLEEAHRVPLEGKQMTPLMVSCDLGLLALWRTTLTPIVLCLFPDRFQHRLAVYEIVKLPSPFFSGRFLKGPLKKMEGHT